MKNVCVGNLQELGSLKKKNMRMICQGSKEIEQFMPDDGDTNRLYPTAVDRNRFMTPAMSRSMATSRELDRF